MTTKKSKVSKRIETPVTLKYSSNLKDYLTTLKPVIKKKVIERIQTEDQVVKSCIKYLRDNGWETNILFTGGIPIGGGKYAPNPCRGIPDCIAFHHTTKRMIWIEFKKSSGGILSPEQHTWHINLKNCKQTVYLVNSLKSLKEQLREE